MSPEPSATPADDSNTSSASPVVTSPAEAEPSTSAPEAQQNGHAEASASQPGDGGEVSQADAVETESEASPDGQESASSAQGDRPAGDRKRRRRRRGKKGASGSPAQASGAEQPAEIAAGEVTGVEGQRAGGKDEKRAPTGKGDGKGRKPRPNRPSGTSENAPTARERTAFHLGEEVFGRVTSVTDDAIMVDLSGKALAIFDRHELASDDLVPEVGDRFVAHVHGDGSRGGLVVLTRKPLREEETKPVLEAAAQSGEAVLGLVTGTVKGGIEVDVNGVRAFAPGSHVDLRQGADLAHLIGKRLQFTVAQYAKRGRDVVVSRKSFVESEAKELRKTSLSKLNPGDVVKGIVRSVVPYGAFVAIPSADEIEGLVHMSEASHDRNAKLHELFKPGAEIDVKVLRVDDRGKLWLSHKATVADPWEELSKKFAHGSRHRGKVVRLQPFGAFVELEPGLDGLVHIADLSFKRIEHPNEILKEGEEIDVVVADLDRATRRVGLHAAPPESEAGEPRQKLAPSKPVKVAVVLAESAGLIVRVIGLTGRQARAFIPAGHTGTDRGTDLRKHFPAGTRLDAKVLELDPRRGEAKLSLRALKEDTEKAAYNEYRQSVAKASKFGTLGDLLAKKR